jgi:hypothetical protein
MNFSPTRRFLGTPAWTWLLLPLILLAVIKVIGPPGPLPEPSDINAMFRDGLLFTRAGDSFRFVPFGQHKLAKPLWSVDPGIATQSTISWGLGQDADGIHFGFYKRTTQWRWSLNTHRFDEESSEKSHEETSLNDTEMLKLRPVLMAELNNRSGGKHWGDVFDKVLHEGRQTSSYLCLQNALILLAWLSLVAALSAVGAMFLGKN